MPPDDRTQPAPRILVVADDRWEDRQPRGVGGGPPLGTQAVRPEVERRRLRRLPPAGRQAGLPEFVQPAIDRIEHDEMTIAEAFALNLRQRRPRRGQCPGVFVVRERPVLDRRVLRDREGSRI